MEFQSYYGSSSLLWNSIAVERISAGSALGRGQIQPARDCTAMEIHSYQGSSHPLRNSIASVNALAGLPMIALPCSPGMRHKTGFFIGYATPAGRSGLMPVGEECYSYGISQLCPAVRQGGRGGSARHGALDRLLWNSRAGATAHGREFTNRYTSCRRVERSAPPAMA
jgi:hypothetical protein